MEEFEAIVNDNVSPKRKKVNEKVTCEKIFDFVIAS